MSEKDLVFEYKQCRGKVEEVKTTLSAAQKELDAATNRLIEHLEDTGATATANYEGIGKVTLKSPTCHARYAPENSDLVFEFLKKEGLEDVIKESVHHSTLSSFIASMIKEGKPVPEFFELSYRKIIAYSKA